MGRSAKLMKRPTQKEKATKKTAKANSRPLSPPPKAQPAATTPQQAAKLKKRRTLRIKADTKAEKKSN